ncbi:hypothetical protein DYB32_008725 [Aphanomyces invadans]|uniref:Uncharacterized protein n=1 Tax=Aphanomyces invadans TaxID=157072 RepID=A0A3R6VG78_9STRA|nr:hypothetical protein DYB32_008725 [Aphanomyces invadans]
MTSALLTEIRSFVTSKRTRTLTLEERLIILNMHAVMRQEDAESGAARDVSVRIAQLVGRSREVVQQVWREYHAEKDVVVKTQPANRQSKTMAIPRDDTVVSSVQGFVRNKRMLRERCVAKDVMAFLREKSLVSYADDLKSNATALRAMQRFLKHCGYKRGHKKGIKSLALTQRNRLARDNYVVKMCEATQHVNLSLRRTVVYLDESFIHHHYKAKNDSLYDPNDVTDMQPKPKHKGRRICFIGAIVDGGPHNSAFINYDSFEGGSKQTKDDHGMFDGEYFVAWFERLVSILDKMGIENALIVMDNAKYHKCLPPDTPKFSMKKLRLQEACVVRGIPYNASDVKSFLWSKLEPVVASVQPTTVAMAEAAGHEVLFTPPHHSELQPIELIWAIVKGQVGRQYDGRTKFSDVGQRLDRAVESLASETIFGCVKEADVHLMELYRYVAAIDAEGLSDGSSDDDVSSDSGEADD